MRIAILAAVVALEAAALIGPAQAGPVGPGNLAAISGSESAAFAGGCPAGYYWHQGRYNRWAIWHPGHCGPARG